MPRWRLDALESIQWHGRLFASSLYFCPFVLAPLHSNRHYLPWWDDDAYMGGQLLAEPSVKIPSSRGLSQRANDLIDASKLCPENSRDKNLQQWRTTTMNGNLPLRPL